MAMHWQCPKGGGRLRTSCLQEASGVQVHKGDVTDGWPARRGSLGVSPSCCECSLLSPFSGLSVLAFCWDLPGKGKGCGRLCGLPLQNLEQLMSNLGVRGSSNRQRGLQASLCTAKSWFLSPSLFPTKQNYNRKWIFQTTELVSGKCDAK